MKCVFFICFQSVSVHMLFILFSIFIDDVGIYISYIEYFIVKAKKLSHRLILKALVKLTLFSC